MSEPKQKSLEVPFLWRLPTLWQIPQWAQATQWRWRVANQSIAMLCRQRLINYLTGIPQEVVARDPNEKDALEEDCRYYNKWVLKKFDLIFELLWQDALDLPIGGNVEIARWPVGYKPEIKDGDEEYRVTRDHPKGHPDRLIFIDGAYLFPTYDDNLPIAERIPEMDVVVYFKPDDLGRIGILPRTEMRLKGYFNPPPFQVWKAFGLVDDSDHFYSDLVRNVPQVGILDLMDMSMQDAQDWVGSVRTLFEGTEPFKIPTLYQHEKPANFIPFGKSPQELMMDKIGQHYARIVAASYGLTLGNLGLEPKGETLAGSIRDDTQAEAGYNFIVEKTKGLLDNEVLPPYLEWSPKLQNNEKLTGKGRAFLVNAQALKAAKDSGFIKPSEGQAQLVRDGFLTVEVEPPNDEELAQQAMAARPGFGPDGRPMNGKEVEKVAGKVPPAQGGRGDVTGKALIELADFKYASTQFDMPDSVIRMLKQLQGRIDPNDLTEDGIEANPHVTIKDGLTYDDAEPIAMLAQYFQPFHIDLGGVSLFEREKFDVIKIDIEDDTLRQLNKVISKTGSVGTHPGYSPHLTIACVKPGMGRKYLDLPVLPQSVLVSVISHSDSEGYITKIPLGNFRELAQVTRADFRPQMAIPLTRALNAMAAKATPQRLKKLARAAAKLILSQVTKAESSDDWQAGLDRVIAGESWHVLPADLVDQLLESYTGAYSGGAIQAAIEVLQAQGEFAAGIDFNLTNPRTLAQLEEKAALLVTRINDGTKFYLKRMLVSGVEEGLASPEIAALIREGAGVDAILKQEGFLDGIAQTVKAELEGMTPARVESIVNTEINRAESEGRLGQWREMGLTRKFWRTFGNACEICRGNEAKGFVEMAFVYDDVFDGTLTPPGHPQVCRCNIEFSEEELQSKAGELTVWTGD